MAPPLLVSSPRLSAPAVTCVNPEQLPSVSKFAPLTVRVPEQSFPSVLIATIECLTLAVALLKIPPPERAEFEATVTKLSLAMPKLEIPPPFCPALFPESVLLVILAVLLLEIYRPPPCWGALLNEISVAVIVAVLPLSL